MSQENVELARRTFDPISPMAWVLTVRDGKVTRHHGYRTREGALDAVGLSE